MSNTAKTIIGTILILIVIIGGTFGYIMGAKFKANEYETAITARFQSMESTWGMMEQQLKMQGFTVKNYGETFIKSLEANAKRYENDKGSMMKWVQEAAGVMSPDMHKKFSDSIEKAYAKKEMKQESKISVAQEYDKWLGSTWKGMIASSFFSYPSAKARKIMDTIVSTKGAKKAMETGIEEEAKDPFAS